MTGMHTLLIFAVVVLSFLCALWWYDKPAPKAGAVESIRKTPNAEQ